MSTDAAIRVSDPALLPVAEKVRAGQVLSFADGVALSRSRDLHGIGRLANFVREKLHGNRTYYNRNRHINYTNVCALSCKFCSFYRKRGEEGAYEMPVEQVIATARKAADAGATEVHIVGGLHPWLKFDYYLDMLRGVRRECPQLHIKAFTAIEIIHLGRISHQSVHDVLVALREAGLGSLPGGGAEIFDDRVHDEVFKGKVRADRWFEVHRTAHGLGIPSNATMLYGHVETPEERIGHFVKLRELQEESLAAMRSAGREDAGTRGRGDAGNEEDDCKLQSANCKVQIEKTGSAAPPAPQFEISDLQFAICNRSPSLPASPRPRVSASSSPACFNCVIPLSFIPEQSELGHLPGNTGLTDLKILAIARLMVHNIAHIKAFWIMQGIGLSQVALDWGCDDLDGTVVWYDITKREGDGTHQELHEKDLRRLIREAGREPVERDTVYRPVRRDPATDRVIVPEPLSVG
ncbi:MAG TPA: radical SAM protein [Tepidisphaeraceae bacterium]|jgi:aminodeoxyfutalosine synthase|nr:radical SAM protein [Tepidisphaeraceae bacterium]